MTKIFLFDTYAILEIIKGNPSYLPYKNVIIRTTQLVLFELYYSLLKENSQQIDRYFKKYYAYIIPCPQTVIREAASFRYTHKKLKLSMTDCIGYCLAQQLRIPFLTGDQAFCNMDGVEFVK